MGDNRVVQLRRDKILQILSTPHTINEISKTMSASYYTVRRDVMLMLEENLVSECGDVRQGSMLFVAGNQRPMPEIRVSPSEYVRLDTLAQGFFNSPKSSNGSRAVLTLAKVIVELLAMSSNAHVNGSLVDTEELKRLEFTGHSALATLESVVSVAKGILSNRVLWDSTLLPSISADPSFSPEGFIAVYEAYLRTLQEEASDDTEGIT